MKNIFTSLLVSLFGLGLSSAGATKIYEPYDVTMIAGWNDVSSRDGLGNWPASPLPSE